MFLSICLPEMGGGGFKKNMYLFSQMAEIKDKGAPTPTSLRVAIHATQRAVAEYCKDHL